MKKLIVFILFVIAIWAAYSFNLIKAPEDIDVIYHDNFKRLDTTFWFVGEWQTNKRVPHKVLIEDGAIKMAVHETDRGPYMLSRPIPLEGKTVLKIKRRVFQHYGNDHFTGGFAVFETDQKNLVPEAKDDVSMDFGNALFLVEYVNNVKEGLERPGTHTFRVLPSDWKTSDSERLVDPVFDAWFTEEIEYHLTTGKLIYTIDERRYETKTQPVTAPCIRVFMHSYGAFTGHYTLVDTLELKLTNPE